MNESLARALSVGAGLFIAMITISAVISYYGTAQASIQKVGIGTDIAGLTNQNITNSLLKDYVSGTEVKNIVNYFYLNKDVIVDVDKVVKFDGTTSGELLRTESGNATFKSVNNPEGTQKKFEILMKNINPSQRFKLIHKTVSGVTTITIEGKR